MDLVLFDRHSPSDDEPADTPEGTQALQLALDRVQSIGVRTAVAESVAVTPTVQATGIVQAAESGRSEVHARAPSFIEKVLVQETGAVVHKGEALALIYSPEIIAMQGEVLAAGQWSDKTSRAAVKQRLALYGLSESEMEALFREGKPRRLLTLRAPQDGVVMARAAVSGGYAMPEVALYELQDLSQLWLEVAVPLAAVAELSRTAVVTAQLPHQAPLPVHFDRVLPQVDAERRTARVRYTFAAPRDGQPAGTSGLPLAVQPGAWLPVTLPVGVAHDAILVPRDAVMDTGHEHYVFVVSDGWYLPTKVKLGALYGERQEILEGVDAGAVVVATGAFLIDAESRVQASVRALSAPATATERGQP
jgi:Cu(I)/Ag(I) efflux system membrane fusion protein